VSGENHYQLSGKEFENDYDLGWSDHGMRRYDPALARWTGVDPLAGLYADMSPYHYVVGNPISFVDLNGAEAGPGSSGGHNGPVCKGGPDVVSAGAIAAGIAAVGIDGADACGDEAESSEEGEEDSGGGGSAFDGGGGMSTDGGGPMSGEYYVYHRSEIQSGGMAAGGGTVTGNLTKALKQFETEFNSAKAKTKADGNEYGYAIYLGSDGKLYLSTEVVGKKTDPSCVNNCEVLVSFDYEAHHISAKAPVGIKLTLAGIYHSHPDHGIDQDPLSFGDINALLIYIQYGNNSGLDIGNGYFTIADDVGGGRYASVLENLEVAKTNLAATTKSLINTPEINSITAGVRARDLYQKVFNTSTGIGIYYHSTNTSKTLKKI
jgi:RHS repeat-associated protein